MGFSFGCHHLGLWSPVWWILAFVPSVSSGGIGKDGPSRATQSYGCDVFLRCCQRNWECGIHSKERDAKAAQCTPTFASATIPANLCVVSGLWYGIEQRRVTCNITGTHLSEATKISLLQAQTCIALRDILEHSMRLLFVNNYSCLQSLLSIMRRSINIKNKVIL